MMGYLNRDDKTSEDIGKFQAHYYFSQSYIVYHKIFQTKMVICIAGI